MITILPKKTKWPPWARDIELLRTDEDKGVGDTVARLIGKANSEQFSAWFLATFGKPCGCPERRDNWNTIYPYA